MDCRVLSLIAITVLLCGLVFADSTPPITEVSVSQVPYIGESLITLTCNDSSIGCKLINYRIDNNIWSSIIDFSDVNWFIYTNEITNIGAGGYPIGGYYLVATIYIPNKPYKTNYIDNITAKRKVSPTETSELYFNMIFNDGTSQTTYNMNTSSTTYIDMGVTFRDTYKNYHDINHIDVYMRDDIGSTGYVKDININYFEVDYNFDYSFYINTSGKHVIEYYSINTNDVNELIKSFDFNTYGSLQFRTFDQNAIADIDGVTINVDGTDYNAIANSWFAYDLQGITTNTTKTFTFSKTGYSNAIYQIDVNEFYDQPDDYFDISLAPTSLSSTVPFKFYKPDGVTLYSNVYAELINTSLDRRIGRIKTNSLGEATFNMIKTDNNYNQILNNGEVTYNPVALTILYPKDEQSQTDITGNWKARTSINYVYSDNNIPDSTSKTIYLQPNTKYAHKISIQDIAENYFERTWDLLYTGNPLTDILQPYLIDADDGTAVTFVFQDPKRDSIENVIVNIYDNILGERTLVTSGSSDITGNALFFLIANKTYELEFIYNGVTILSTTNYTVTTNKVYWTIDLTGQEIKKIDQSYFNIRWTPFVDYTSSDTLNLGYVATGKNINYTSVNFYKLNTDGTKTITHTYQKSCTTPCTVSVPLTDVNISSGNIYADANIYSDSNTVYFTYTKRWSAGTEKSINTQNLFINARRSFGCSIDTAIPCPLTNITAVIIMILVLGGIVFKFNFSNPKGLLVIGLGILGVFTYLGWFWWIPLVLMIIGSIFYLRGDN